MFRSNLRRGAIASVFVAALAVAGPRPAAAESLGWRQAFDWLSRLWGGVTLTTAAGDCGFEIDPNGCPRGNAGLEIDPSGDTVNAGPEVDPSGSPTTNGDCGPEVDPNGGCRQSGG
jgi:hypothetical protein